MPTETAALLEDPQRIFGSLAHRTVSTRPGRTRRNQSDMSHDGNVLLRKMFDDPQAA